MLIANSNPNWNALAWKRQTPWQSLLAWGLKLPETSNNRNDPKGLKRPFHVHTPAQRERSKERILNKWSVESRRFLYQFYVYKDPTVNISHKTSFLIMVPHCNWHEYAIADKISPINRNNEKVVKKGAAFLLEGRGASLFIHWAINAVQAHRDLHWHWMNPVNKQAAAKVYWENHETQYVANTLWLGL